MARFLISTAALPGHLDWGGLLPTAGRLLELGHAVLWLSGPAVAERLAAAGIPFEAVPVAFQPPQDGLPPAETTALLYAAELQRTIDTWTQEDQVAAACQAHCAVIQQWQPDVLVADPMVLAAALAAEAMDVPLAACGYPGPYLVLRSMPETTGVIADWYRRLNALRRDLKLAPVAEVPDPAFPFMAPDLHLVFFPEDWFVSYNPRQSPGAQFVGGHRRYPASPPPTWLTELPYDCPLVIVTQSTTYGPPASTLRLIIEAIGAVGGYGIVAGSADKRRLCEPLPAYIRWEEWLDYGHLLPLSAAIVHHGGMATTHAAVCAAVPQVVTPAAADQFIHAERVMALGVGLAIPPQHLSAAVLTAALRKVLVEPGYRQRALALQERFARCGGMERAAAILLSFAHMIKSRYNTT
ncbi:glycosyltransferase [Kallotenue papyrolyticum]|uniref:glycosyltransferase n=1 Tax=Kallotenue papyrolyticum TaxID=1325125 RepID=UPI000492C9BB|nr:nucleotide disphospho-sugar-binding domain-containing protein [Kallotenue papyrolyticum]